MSNLEMNNIVQIYPVPGPDWDNQTELTKKETDAGNIALRH